MADTRPEQRLEVSILGVDIAFRPEADPVRIDWAKRFVEGEYEKLELRGRNASRERLLILLVMGIAGELFQSEQDLLQSRQNMHEMQARLEVLLSRIEEANITCPDLPGFDRM